MIAVAGKYRTGKSFLLNRIILNKTEEKGFGVGPTINPCTKVISKEPLNYVGTLALDKANRIRAAWGKSPQSLHH